MQITQFKNTEFGVLRVERGEDGQPWFVAADVCAALDIANSRDAVSRLDADEKGVANTDTPGGLQRVGVVNESGLYSLILTSRKPQAHAFKRWVTHEVLPAIRQTGGYMVARADETPEETLARAVIIAQQTIERQKAQLDEAAPKVAFADALTASGATCLIRDFCKTVAAQGYSVRERPFFAWLRRNGYLTRDNKPMRRYVDSGLFEVNVTTVSTNHGTKETFTPRLTGKGQRYFFDKIAAGEVA